jgi:hypothetical protein
VHAQRERAAGRHHRGVMAAAVGLGALAGLTKEMAATLPLAALLVDAVAFPGAPGRVRRVAPMLLLALVVPAVAVLGHSFGVAGGELTRESAEVGRRTYALTQLDVVARYLKLLVFPIGQNVDHDVPWRHGWAGGSPPLLLLGTLHIAWVTCVTLAWARGHRFWALGGLWLALTVLPESSLFPIRDAMFEHRMYLPLFGAALLGGGGCWSSGWPVGSRRWRPLPSAR